MGRILALTFEYGGEVCSCLISFHTKEDEIELTISSIQAEGYGVLAAPVVVTAKNGRILSNKTLEDEIPILKPIGKSLDHYLKKNIGKLAADL